jgi:hypothetical protein
MEEVKTNKKNIGWILPVIFIILIVVVFVMLWFLMRGRTTITGNGSETEQTRAISCSVSNLDYPFFDFNESSEQSTRINATFKGNKIESISLIHKMAYEDPTTLKKSEASNHAAMNNSFGNILGADALGVTYDTANGEFQMTLYATKGELNEHSRKYFLFEVPLANMQEYVDHYERQGFKCVVKAD